MATRIEWAQDVWNPVLGCSRVSPGCDNCYAIRQSRMRAANPNAKVAAAHAGLADHIDGRLDWTGQVNLIEERLHAPLRRKKPTRYFVNSGSDLFHGNVPASFIARVFAVMSQARQHTFLILTKRSGRMRSLLSSEDFIEEVQSLDALYDNPDGHHLGDGWPLANVWLGVSVEDQKRADLRIPILLDTPAAVRWISAEPLLGPLYVEDYLLSDVYRCACGAWETYGTRFTGCPRCGTSWKYAPGERKLDWVVAGGESGPGARPMSPRWARSLRDQCRRARAAFYFKQWGEWGPAPFVVRVPLGEDGRWHGTEAELEDAKRAAEARGATHVHTHNSYTDVDGNTLWHVHEIGHKPWSLERVALPEGPEPIRKWGKAAAGRELDGVVWEQYPKAVTA